MSSLGNKEVMSDNLNRIMNQRGITRNKLADDLDFKYTTLTGWLKGQTYPRIDKIEKMANYFNIPKSALIEKKHDQLDNMVKLTNENTTMVPIVGSIACGTPITAEENIEGYSPMLTSDLPSGNNYKLICKGHSMEPGIPDGAEVLINETPDVENDEVAAVMINGEVTLKRIKKDGKQIILSPDNRDYNPIILKPDDDNKILGKAIKVTITL